ncbi:MAG: ABC transporter permease [Methanosarcinaceae archaeon]|jgi:ribose transport system permease protein|nr:ABC transporter permease [Methanosarcinaceae archaeon]
MNANNTALKKIIPAQETLVLVGILISMVLFFQFFTSTFIDKANLLDILKEASKLCVISFGMAIIIAAGGIDLSLGHIAGFSAIIATTILKEYNVGIVVGLMCGISIGLIFGLFNGLLVSYLGISSFIVTLGTQFIILGLRYWITSGNIIMFLPDAYTIIGNGKIFSIHNTILIMIALAIICYYQMERTVFGRRVSSTGGNITASWLSCINIRKYTMLTFVMGGIFASITGIVHTSHMEVVSVDIGDGFLLDALIIAVFSVVVYGRMKTLGVILVTVLLVALTNGLTMMGVNPFFVKFVKGSLLLGALSINMAMQSEYVINRMYKSKAQI